MKGHTGKIRHADHVNHLRSHGGKDKMASKEHHAANAAHGMDEGFSPGEGYEHGGKETGGAPSMESNCCSED